MRRKLITGLIAGMTWLSPNVPAVAHHSFSAQFDATKPIALQGVVTKVEWMNPHIWFYLDVKDEATGKVHNWSFEMGSPNALANLGWTRSSLKVGDEVSVNGYLAKNGTRTVNAKEVRLSDGRQVLAGSSLGNEPGRK